MTVKVLSCWLYQTNISSVTASNIPRIAAAAAATPRPSGTEHWQILGSHNSHSAINQH